MGQSDDLVRRIHEHAKAFTDQHDGTLLYWISSRSFRREMNFIQLWTLPEDITNSSKECYNILNNIIEMLMSLCFQSLPQTQLSMFLAGHQDLATTGLNVTSPLVQGVKLSGNEKEAYRNQLLDSVDPEIRAFPQARKDQLRKMHWPSVSEQLTATNYQEALAEACSSLAFAQNLGLPFDGSLPCSREHALDLTIETAIQEAAHKLEKLTGSTVQLSMPFGSFTARLGIILDHDLLRNDESDIPTALKEIGFDRENCLIWPFNLQNHYLGSSSKIRRLGSETTDILHPLNQNIIELYGLRVIILCGNNAEACIFPRKCIKLISNSRIVHTGHSCRSKIPALRESTSMPQQQFLPYTQSTGMKA